MKMQVKIEEQIYEVEVEDVNTRPVIALVDGERVEVWPEEVTPEFPVTRTEVPDLRRSEAPAPVAKPGTASNGLAVTSPLPGVIVSVDVKPGDVVKHGQTLCTLEAMKMKNAIRSTREGTIAEVLVANGDQVQHGQTLITYKA